MSPVSTALAEAEKRSVSITSTNGESVIYDGNPAALAGVRHEINQCFLRTGAFEMLIKHNAATLPNMMIATEDVSNIPFVTDVLQDLHELGGSPVPCAGF